MSHIKNPTLSFDPYLLEDHSCQISSQSDWKQQSLGLFLKSINAVIPARRRRTRWLAIWDQFLVQKADQTF